MGRDAAGGGALGEAYIDALSQRGDVLPGGTLGAGRGGAPGTAWAR